MAFKGEVRKAWLRITSRPGKGIAAYLRDTPAGNRRVVFGGHWSNNPGWLLLSKIDQDITKPLKFPDSSVDCVYSEHVIEHVDLAGTVSFLKEAFRILAPGGTIRIICPMLDQLLESDLGSARGTQYVAAALSPQYSRENSILKGMGLPELGSEAKLFQLNSIFRQHGHRFIWNAALLKKVLTAIGFDGVVERRIGESYEPANAIERRNRGIYLGHDWQCELKSASIFDPESGIVEARKPAHCRDRVET